MTSFLFVKNKMNIAIDYDKTFSADPEGWIQVITLMEARGHKFVCVTGRTNEFDFGKEVILAINNLIPIVFAGQKWKKQAAEEAGWKIDIWIDDMPEYIAKQNILFGE